MAQSTILAAGTTAATSTDVIVPAGDVASVGLFVASGEIPRDVKFDVLMDSPGADVEISTLTRERPSTVIAGPGTFRVARRTAGRDGTSVGVFSEA